jgi:hypothetical protein
MIDAHPVAGRFDGLTSTGGFACLDQRGPAGLPTAAPRLNTLNFGLVSLWLRSQRRPRART